MSGAAQDLLAAARARWRIAFHSRARFMERWLSLAPLDNTPTPPTRDE